MIREITDKNEWNTTVQAQGGHPLQLWGWGEVKGRHGWRAKRLVVSEAPWAGVQVLFRAVPGPFGSFAYVPRGPVGKWSAKQLNELADYVKHTHGALVLSLEPHAEEWIGADGWQKAANDVLIARTLILDLTKPEDDLLAEMSKKTRQYIRKSTNDGVTVRRATADDVDACLAIYADTAKRANFALHGNEYYKDVLTELGDNSPIFVAEFDGEIVAFLWLAASDSVAFELYGGVTDKGQEVRANYALKWQAIRAMKAAGVEEYDLNGLLNDGISTFKAGFGSEETMLIGTYDKPLSPLYTVWAKGLPLAKKIVRTLKR